MSFLLSLLPSFLTSLLVLLSCLVISICSGHKADLRAKSICIDGGVIMS